ncbi:cytochrome P450, family 81, subfamily K, polypeptide 1 [Actinidia rufa]|uniref:Cytochrome P450, family 81, subfamily K, polypeptide 1 n=1 Tax=Actinidia rufa TaxID=165716 RepID=A0A7J0EI25_9ERIC|nr:cytochrome P450, family 81, subfamily K, polypeptide 1 [Actinidia rufa]
MENSYYYLAFLLVSLLLLSKRFLNKARKSPPSPLALPIIGHLHLLTKAPPQQALANLASKYGPILFLRFGSRPTLVISSPSAIEECFTKNDVVFANRPQSMAGDHLTYNYTSFVWTPYGHLWRSLRRLAVIELFSFKSLHKSSLIREDETLNLLSHLFSISIGGNRTVDLKYWFSLLVFNIVMRLVNGERCVRDEDAGTESGKKILEGLWGKFVISTPVNLCDFVPILRWIDYKGFEKMLAMLHKERDEFLQGLIDEYRLKKSSDSSGIGENKSTMIGSLLRLQESEPEFYSDDLIKSMLLVMFLGGIGTSANTMERAISLLLIHPEAFHKVRAEIDTQVGHSRLLDESDLANLPYLYCVIKETLRLYPPVPLLDPTVWDEPNKFKPERFEGIEWGREGPKFVPFGMGRRACPGAIMGVRAISLAVGSLIQCFELEMVGQKKGDMNQGFELPSDKPDQALEAVCIPRQNAIELLSPLRN